MKHFREPKSFMSGQTPAGLGIASEGPTTNITDDSKPWSQADMFLLSELSALEKVQTTSGHWLGAYQGFQGRFAQGEPCLELLCASQSASAIRRELEEIGANVPVFFRRAVSKDDLPKLIEPAKPDRWAQLRRSAYEAVGEARRSLDPDSPSLPFVPLNGYEWFIHELMSFDQLITESEAKFLHKAIGELYWTLAKIEDRARNWNLSRPEEYSDRANEFAAELQAQREKGSFDVANSEAQHKIQKFLANSEEIVKRRFEKMRQAADFLHTIANGARAKGVKAGDRATCKETRKVIAALRDLANDVPLKAITQVEINGEVDDGESLKRYKSLERLVSRFCKRVAEAVVRQYGPGITSLNYSHLSYALRELPWIDRNRDKSALMEAARRGLPHLRLP